METSTEGAAQSRGEAAGQPDPQVAAEGTATVAVPEPEAGAGMDAETVPEPETRAATDVETVPEPSASSGIDATAAPASEPGTTSTDAAAASEPDSRGTDADEAAAAGDLAAADAQGAKADGTDRSVEDTTSTPGGLGTATAIPPVTPAPTSSRAGIAPTTSPVDATSTEPLVDTATTTSPIDTATSEPLVDAASTTPLVDTATTGPPLDTAATITSEDTAATAPPLDTATTTKPVAAPPVSLSPSRASDFMQCPLLYRFRVIDRLPEKPSEAATRGTLVHAVLERLFDAPAGERTAPRAKALIPGQWDRLRENRPEVVELFEDDPGGERLARWLGEAEQLVERWFTLEDPTRLEPAERELFVEAELDSGLRLRGIIDRVDVAPTGEVRIVDYKTGRAPRPEYAEGALFQMKFYALVVWRLKRVIPRRLQLVYLGSGDVLTYDPVLADLQRVERKLLALWEAIRQATESGDWRPRPTKLCGWCDHQAHCPEFGGTPPPYPLPVRAVGSVDVAQGRMGPD